MQSVFQEKVNEVCLAAHRGTVVKHYRLGLADNTLCKQPMRRVVRAWSLARECLVCVREKRKLDLLAEEERGRLAAFSGQEVRAE